ncbi:MAG: hypothetical protein M1828_004581 [Chrysothrix sp. TS-e1954]|nr:MAG: hypothetical protein M1828_004581 [Chrysothrix sp. TS-e1954]
MSKVSMNASRENTAPEKSFFEQQRGLLVRDIGVSLENVLQNLNNLNRNLEGIIAVGNEFSSVEALWSHFENVMAKDSTSAEAETNGGQDEETHQPQSESKSEGG